MATDLVTVDEARDHLRLDFDGSASPDDGWLAVFIPAISEAVSSWLKVESRLYMPELDSAGEPIYDSGGDPVPAEPLTVRPLVKAAVLLELGNVYRFREGEGKDNVVPDAAGWGYVLNKTSTALLAGLRRSTVA
jgi:hypothetical protein